MTAKITDYKQYFQDRSKLNANGCWIWQGCKFNTGYGYMKYQMQSGKLAHRICYEVFKGPIPKGLLVCHSCDVLTCINPEHLVARTRADNLAGMVTRGRSKSGKFALWSYPSLDN